MSALQIALLLVFASCSIASKPEGPVYLLEDNISSRLVQTNVQYQEENNLSPENPFEFSAEEKYEWESYDGWFNNPAHPEWGGYDMPLERKTPVEYPDGVYEIIPEEERANALLVSNISQHGLSGMPAKRRTAFFTFFGQQVVEEILDAQRPGCIPEYENIRVPKCHPIYDPNCNAERRIPFLRSRYDFSTGYAPNHPREQLNEITPWMDGGLVYGPFKAWTDAIRSFENGELSAQGVDGHTIDHYDRDAVPIDIRNMIPLRNDKGLPLVNPAPPANESYFPVDRFWTIGNPRGNENPFLLSMGILWFRVHNFWARQIRARLTAVEDSDIHDLADDDEFLFNRARQFTIATYQHIVYTEWLPLLIPSKFPNGLPPYNATEGYSAFFGRSGYNQAINPQVAHIFQSAAMRWGHTMVTPGVWRRELPPIPSVNQCLFGSPLSPTDGGTNAFLSRISDRDHSSWRDVTDTYYKPFMNGEDFPEDNTQDYRTLFNMLNRSVESSLIDSPAYSMDANDNHFGVRTCNSYWNPQVTIRETNVDGFYLGMASQAAEREDTIITPDLRGNVFGPLEYTRRDLMAVNMQRARDHGLPNYNAALKAYALKEKNSFEEINPLYGVDEIVTRNIENLRDIYNNDIEKCDIWACGLAETIPSDNDYYSRESGPGELFSEVLYDQFMRIRHADRFWYENYELNGIFTKEEFEIIQSLTLKDLLIATTHIRDEDIGSNPFDFGTAVCPQPFQLSELWMDDCIGIDYFDYYAQSEYEIPIVWGVTFIYIALVIMTMFMLAAYNQQRRTKILSAGLTSRAKKIEGTDLTGGDGEVLVAYELHAGLKDETRLASMKFGPGKRIKLFSGDTVLREVDLRQQSEIMIQRPFDDQVHFVVKIPNEYDIIIRCNNTIDRTTFIDKIRNFLDNINVGRTIEEPQKKVMLRSVFTKKQRQSLLENFFKSVFREGAQPGIGGETNRAILECELTRGEFADAMSLKPDSLFVDQMFELIDQDGNGFVSFREFLDMIVIFAKGSPEDKIKLMFDMYDVDKSGSLDRIEFKKMLKAMMEMVSAQVSPDQMDQLIESMFAAAGFQNKEDLTLRDFNILLRDHKEELSNAHLNVKGYDVPEVEIERKEPTKGEGEALPSRFRSRETAPARARRTIIRAYGKTSKDDPKAKSVDMDKSVVDAAIRPDATPSFNIPTQKRSTYSQSTLGRYTAVYIRYIENNKLQIFYFVLYFLVVAGIFIERAYYYSVEREHSGLRRIAGYGVTVTRGAASGMMFTYSILLLTMARNFITYLRETIFNNYVPFDSYISAHKIIALTALFFTIMHAVGHGINFYHISTQVPDDLSCLFREVYHRSHILPKFSYWLFQTMTGFAGFLVSLITVIIFVFATQYARRYTYRAFWVTHHWYVIFYILAFLHGSGRLVQDPLFGNFFLGPGIVYALNLLISVGRRTSEVAVVRVDILPSQVTGIYFKRPITFDYRAGQWLKVASAAQNPGEFHSFTISSAPHEEYLSLHIRAVGPWTFNFRENYNPANLHGKSFPKLFIDGPFGEGHQDWFRYEVAVLVGGGIGVTPFASILKELVHRFNIGTKVECKKVFFIWVTRTQKQYEWFTEIIHDVEEADKQFLVENHIFVTQFFDKFDLRTTMLYICERHFQRLSGKSLFTGLRATTHFGRPDFNQFFDNLQEEYILLPKIGVFSCGPPGMTNGVEAACAATNRFEGPAFLHHYENF